MKTIYRIEDKKGKSCYNFQYAEALDVLIGKEWDKTFSHRPPPQCDQGINRRMWHKEICGFKNVRQTLKWFSASEIRKMRRLGLDIKKVKVQKITAIGKCQILAIRG